MAIRAGGHVRTNKGWMPEVHLPEDAVEDSDGVYQIPVAEEPDISGHSIGGDWYNIGGEQIHGRTEALKAFRALEAAESFSMSNTKAELLAAAEGLDVDESNTKAEILEALNA